MKLKVTQSGGMVAAPPRVVVNLDEVPNGLARQLRDIVAAGKLSGTDAAAVPDGYGYVLELEDDGPKRRFEFAEGAVEPDVLDLIDDILEAARQSRKR